MRKISILISIFLIFLVVFVGCGKKDQASSGLGKLIEEGNQNYLKEGVTEDYAIADIEKAKQEEVDHPFIIPTDKISGVVEKINFTGSMGNIIIKTADGSKDFVLNIDTVIFDASTAKVVKPSSIKSGQLVTIHYTKEVDGDTALTVMSGIDADVLFIGKDLKEPFVEELEKIKLAVDKKTVITNALSGEPYKVEDIKAGDKIFYYVEPDEETGEIPNIAQILQEQGENADIKSELYRVYKMAVYPAPVEHSEE